MSAAGEAAAGRDWAGLAGAAAAILLGGWMLHEAAAFSDFAAVFPRTIAMVMIAASLLLAGRILLVPAVRTRPEPGSPGRRLALVAVAVAWVAAMPVAGFLAASLAGFLATMRVARFTPWSTRQAVFEGLAALAIVGGFYLVFEWGLGVPLPRGWLI